MKNFATAQPNQSFLVESVSGVETAKSLALEPQMQSLWEDQLANYVHSSFRVQRFNNTISHRRFD